MATMSISDQEAFDRVVEHLYTQKKRSLINDHAKDCCYRNPNGLKCAIGALIPDELYNPRMDTDGECGPSMSVSRLLREFPELEEHVPFDLAFQLQEAHDSLWTREDLASLAESRGLDPSILEGKPMRWWDDS